MKTKLKYGFILAFVLLYISSCQKETLDVDKASEMGYDYVPIVKDSYRIFNIEQITIDAEIGKFDTLRYQLKEVLVDTIYSTQTDSQTYKIEQFTRTDSTKIWDIKNVYKVVKSNTNYIRFEENVPIVSMVFPVKYGQTWNINRYNTLDEKETTLEAVDKQDTSGAFIFPKVVSSIQADYESLIDKQYEIEKYARGVGLVYKQQIDVESQNYGNVVVDMSKPIMKRITKGTIQTWILASYK